MASLGLITGILGFNETGTALILTVFALQDSFVHFVMNRVDNVLSRKLSNRAKLSGIPSE